jgi:Phage P22-like portal protein
MPDNDEFLALARKRFTAAAEEEKELREAFASDLRFASPDGEGQWDPQVKMQREQAMRPAMSFPRCHTFVQQVANEGRQKKPQIKFSPRLDQDKDTAEILEGIARYIQYDSQSQVAYETALKYSASASWGFYRFLTEYADDESDDLKLVIKPVLDPLTVYGVVVPAVFGRKPRFWFVIEDLPKEEYKVKYGDTDLAGLSWPEAEKRAEGWVGENTVRIAEYWWVEEKAVKGKRRPEVTIHTCKTNGLEILPGDDGESSETIWPGTICNIVPVLGDQFIIDGQPRLYSVVRPQKSAQQLINYSKSRIAETLSTSPISPFMVAEGQISGYENEWATLNTVNRPFLTYKVTDNAGRPIPPPQRQTFEPPIQALSAFVAQEVDDMKATTGIFDASLGNQANETSGRAILARKDQSNLSTMHYLDNLGRSFKQGGDIIAEIVPIIYDTERETEILGEDEKQKIVTINKEYEETPGRMKHYKVKGAKMSYVVTMGQAFDSKRAETFDTMQQVLQGNPQLMNVVGDILFRNYDGAGADQIADRLKKMLPPQLQGDDDQQIPPQAQAAISQLQQQGQALNAHAQILEKQLGQLQYEKQAKVVELQGRLQEIAAKHQADMELEDKKLLAQLAVAEISTKAQIATERQGAVNDLEAQLHEQAHELALQKDDQAHAQDMAQQQAEQAQQMQAQQAEQQAQQPQDNS